MPKVLPTVGLQPRSSTGLVDERYLLAPGDLANAGDRHSRDLGRHATLPPGGKQQFIIFAAMKREIQLDWFKRFAQQRARNCLCPNLSTHAAFLANMI